jgi:hypothetical protein
LSASTRSAEGIRGVVDTDRERAARRARRDERARADDEELERLRLTRKSGEHDAENTKT